jgi:hypothetical protein
MDFLKWLEESERITGEATGGPWVHNSHGRGISQDRPGGLVIVHDREGFVFPGDKVFAAHARAAMPKLQAMVRFLADNDLCEDGCEKCGRDRAARLQAIIDEDGEGG